MEIDTSPSPTTDKVGRSKDGIELTDNRLSVHDYRLPIISGARKNLFLMQNTPLVKGKAG